jgi:hypothetical protein
VQVFWLPGLTRMQSLPTGAEAQYVYDTSQKEIRTTSIQMGKLGTPTVTTSHAARFHVKATLIGPYTLSTPDSPTLPTKPLQLPSWTAQCGAQKTNKPTLSPLPHTLSRSLSRSLALSRSLSFFLFSPSSDSKPHLFHLHIPNLPG